MHGRPDPVPPTTSLATGLADSAAARPEDPALVYAGQALSYRELAAAADRLAAELRCRPGERVAVVAPNLPALVAGMFAAWRAGAVAVPLNARLRRFELERAFADAAPAAAVCLTSHAGFAIADEVARLGARTPSLRTATVVDELGQILDTRRWPEGAAADLESEELAGILYTSGTTGEPKGALLPHAQADAFARAVATLLGDDAEAPFGLVVPASHAFGLGCLLAGILAGATALLVEVATSLEPLLRPLRERGARVLHGSPTLFGRILRAGAELPVRSGLVAGSLCPPEVLQQLDERGTRILNVYGMTEIGAASSCRPGDPPPVRYGMVGSALPGYELRVAGGEVQVRSDLIPDRYRGRPFGEAELTPDGWFRTGDLGEIDAGGNLTIAGRAREVVHVGGFNVFPAEVENFLLTHPAIAQAAAIGAPHPVLGEALEAFVVPAGGATLEPREVVRFARAGIAGYKVPYAVHVLDELPQLPSGKPDRRELTRLSECSAEQAAARASERSRAAR